MSLRRRLLDRVRRVAAEPAPAGAIADGAPDPDPVAEVVAAVRDHLAERRLAPARVLAIAHCEDPSDPAGLLATGLVRHVAGRHDLAHASFAAVPTELLARHVPREAVESALREGDAVAARAVADRADLAPTPALVDLAGRFLVAGDGDTARALVAEVDRRGAGGLGRRPSRQLANLRRWTGPEPETAPQTAGQGSVTLGVLDYHQPDLQRSSRNVGDYVQTLAMLGNLVRHTSVRFTGDEGLGGLAATLQQRVRPDLRVEGPPTDVRLVRVSRDFSEGDRLPSPTWVLAFGWHLHSLFGQRFGLPYHRDVRPLFVSFHVNRVSALTPAALDQLRTYGPVGCRDRTTTELLLGAGVDAFFTGCLTTTVDAVFPPLAEVCRDRPGVVGLVDLPDAVARAEADEAELPVEVLTHRDTRYRDADLVTGTTAAVELLEGYRTRFARVVTSRLHSYLPATSLGLDVRFAPRVPGDVRFDGLLGLTPDSPDLVSIRDGIRDLITSALAPVLAGAGEDEVYARWRELTAPLVAEARDRMTATPRPRVATAGPATPTTTDRVDVVVALGQGGVEVAATTLASASRATSVPLRVHVLADEPAVRRLADRLPDLDVRALAGGPLEVADRLADADRAVWLAPGALVGGDLAELAGTDLTAGPVAARTSPGLLVEVGRVAADRLAPADAFALRHLLAPLHGLDVPALATGVMVWDLARMRADGLAAAWGPVAASYSLDLREALHAYVGAARTDLDARWAADPLVEEPAADGIVLYGGPCSPWSDEQVPYAAWWREAALTGPGRRPA